MRIYTHSNCAQPNRTHVCIHTHTHTPGCWAREGSLHLSSHTKLLVQSLSGRASSLLYRQDDRVTAEIASSLSPSHLSVSLPPLLSTSSFIHKAKPFVLDSKIRKKCDICKPNEACMAGSCAPSKAEANCVLSTPNKWLGERERDFWSEW